jgi:hypothetical protein
VTDWNHACVLCAARGKTTRLESGHCCVPCAGWLMTTVADITRLAADAAAFITPGSSNGSGSRPVPGSRPPCNVESLDPENTTVTGYGATVLELCEAWERMIRSDRGMAPYGPASAARMTDGLYAGTSASLVGVVGFLGGQVSWMTTEPTFPLEDFADEMRACVRVLRRWDVTAQDRGQMVRCPTLHEDEGECGAQLYYASMDEQVTCPRCRVSRDAAQLLMAVDADNAWVDGEALARRFGIDPSTIRKWARANKVQRQGQRYRYGDVRERVESMRRGA